MPTSMKRTIRRHELRKMVPLADTTIYEMEKEGKFPKRFPLTQRCVVWDYDEVVAWIEKQKQAARETKKSAPGPDVRQRKRNPVRASSASQVN